MKKIETRRFIETRGTVEQLSERLANDLLSVKFEDGSPAPVLAVANRYVVWTGSCWNFVSYGELKEHCFKIYKGYEREVMEAVTPKLLNSYLWRSLELASSFAFEGRSAINYSSHGVVMGNELVRFDKNGRITRAESQYNDSTAMAVPFSYGELENYDWTGAQFARRSLAHLFKGRNDEARWLGAWFFYKYVAPPVKLSVAPILSGVGASGKSTFTDAVLHMAKVNNQVVSYADFESIIGKDSRFNRMPLTSHRFAVMADTTMGYNSNWNALKPLITGEDVSVELKGIDAVTRPVTAAIVANTNSESTADTFAKDSGLARRIVNFHFEDEVAVEDRLAGLDAMLASTEEQKAIWAWMLQAYLSYDGKHLSKTIPQANKVEMTTAENDDDVLSKAIRLAGASVAPVEGVEPETMREGGLMTWVRKVYLNADLNNTAADDFISTKEFEKFNKRQLKATAARIGLKYEKDEYRNKSYYLWV